MDIISFIADLFSVLAFGITIWTLLNVKKVKLLTKEAIKKFDRSFTIADLSRAYKTIDEIHGYIGRKEYSLAILRLNDLKILLSYLQDLKERKELINNEDYGNLISNYYLHIENMKRYVSNNEIKIKIDKIASDLSIISKIFLDLENKLKRNHE